MEDLIKEMIAYRARNSMTQAQFAERCGLSTMTINAIENGKQSATALTREKIRQVVEGE